MRVRVENDAVSAAGRAAHEMGVAAILGGNLFGRLAMHPAMARISDAGQRGEVVNASWRRYGLINGLSLAAVVAGWVGARAGETRARFLREDERNLARAKDIAVGTVTLTGAALAIEGVRFSKMEPQGAVPLSDGETAAPEATDAEARAKRRLNALGAVNLVAAAALQAINSSLAQKNFRRPPARRLFARRY
jgi:hypothetical protein